jgi:hypothetical protein
VGDKDCMIVLPKKIVNEVASLLSVDGYKINFESMPDNMVTFPGDEEKPLINISWRGA